jgi:hypothetical protein
MTGDVKGEFLRETEQAQKSRAAGRQKRSGQNKIEKESKRTKFLLSFLSSVGIIKNEKLKSGSPRRR